MSPDEVREALPIIRSRCEEIDRDPASLAVSVHIWMRDMAESRAARVDRLAAFAELGISRVMGFVAACVDTDEALESVVADAREAGVEIG
jgi:hypothetical protein